MDSSVSPKDKIWFLRVCHHISNAVYLSSNATFQVGLQATCYSKQKWFLLCFLQTYQRIKANRQGRLRIKNRKRKVDEATCPVCNERVQGSVEELNSHVEMCLRKVSRPTVLFVTNWQRVVERGDFTRWFFRSLCNVQKKKKIRFWNPPCVFVQHILNCRRRCRMSIYRPIWCRNCRDERDRVSGRLYRWLK